MIDSNNISVIRENLRTLANINSGLITNIEANTDAISEINALVGTTPLPEGLTLTLAIDELFDRNPFSNSVLGGTFTRSGQTLMLRFYTTPSRIDDDSVLIQFRGGNNDIRYVIKEAGVTTYDKKATLS